MFKLCELQSQHSVSNGDVSDSVDKTMKSESIFHLNEKHKKEPLVIDLKSISVETLEKLKKF